MPANDSIARRKKRETHGMSRSPEHRIWSGIRSRAVTGSHRSGINYVDRGITMCEEWDSFVAFYRHVGPRPSRSHTIERIDNDKGYEPGNVRWATRREQNRNTRRTHLITYRGETLCLKDWAARIGIDRDWLRKRLETDGWTVERAFTEPVLNQRSSKSPEENRKANIARCHLDRAIKRGVLSRPDRCQQCGNRDRKILGVHHLGHDPEHWLDVLWLCFKCRNERRRDALRDESGPRPP